MAGWSSLSPFTVGVRAVALPARASSLLGRGQPEKSGLAAWDPPQVDLVVKDLWGEAISQILRFWSTQEGNRGVWTQRLPQDSRVGALGRCC